MAKTYPRRALKVVFPSDVLQQVAIVTYFDGLHSGSFTGEPFLAGWPLEDDGGGRVIAWDPFAGGNQEIIEGFAAEDSPNVLGAPVRVYRNHPGLTMLEGNLMTGAGPPDDYVLTQSDLLEIHRFQFDDNYLGTGKPGYYIDESGSNTCRSTDFRSSYVISNEVESVAEPGDTNAIIRVWVTNPYLPTLETS